MIGARVGSQEGDLLPGWGLKALQIEEDLQTQ